MKRISLFIILLLLFITNITNAQWTGSRGSFKVAYARGGSLFVDIITIMDSTKGLTITGFDTVFADDVFFKTGGISLTSLPDVSYISVDSIRKYLKSIITFEDSVGIGILRLDTLVAFNRDTLGNPGDASTDTITVMSIMNHKADLLVQGVSVESTLTIAGDTSIGRTTIDSLISDSLFLAVLKADFADSVKNSLFDTISPNETDGNDSIFMNGRVYYLQLGTLFDTDSLEATVFNVTKTIAGTLDVVRLGVDTIYAVNLDTIYAISPIKGTSFTGDTVSVTTVIGNITAFSDSITQLADSLANYSTSIIMAESLATKATITDLNLKISSADAGESLATKATITNLDLKLDRGAFGDSIGNIDSTYITNDALGFEDIANLPEEFARLEALDDSTWDSIRVNSKIAFTGGLEAGSGDLVLTTSPAESSLVLQHGGTDTFFVLTEHNLSEHRIVWDFGNIITPTFDTTWNTVSYKVTAIRTDSFWAGSSKVYIAFTSDSTNGQQVVANVKFNTPYDFKELAEDPAFRFDYKYGSTDTNTADTNKIHVQINNAVSPAGVSYDTTMLGNAAASWATLSITKTQMEAHDANWATLGKGTDLNFRFEITVGAGSVFLSKAIMYYRKDRTYEITF